MTSPAKDTAQKSIDELLNPSLDDLRKRFYDAWSTDLTDPELREDMFGNVRVQKRLVQQILQENKVELDEPVRSFVGERELRFILENNHHDVFTNIGAAWHSNTLADLVSRGVVKKLFPDLKRASIKFALQFRDRAIVHGPDLDRQNISLEQDGMSCFWCWAKALSPAVAKRILLKFPISDRKSDSALDGQKKILCRSVLTALSEQEVKL